MSSTFSSLLRVELIGTGDQSGTWGSTTNENLGVILEDAIAGTATIDVTAGNVTLTNVDGAADQARCMILKVIGTPGTSRNIVAPSTSKVYVVINGSNDSVVLKGSATTGLTIASGDRVTVAFNGTDFVQIGSTSDAGDVSGPVSSTDNEIVLFDGTSGTLLKNSSKVVPTGVIVGTTDTQTLTNKTLSGADNTLTVDGTDAVGFRNIPQNSQSDAYTLVLADSGKHILHPSADTTARTFTIPANSSVAYPIGTALTFINQNGAGVVTIAITTDTMRLSPAGTTGSRTLAANGSATCIKLTSTEWLISGSGLT